MDWKEIQDTTKSFADAAVQKINEVTDLTALYIDLKKSEHRLNTLYTEFGKATYRNFTTDEEGGAEMIAKYVEAITLEKRQAETIRSAIRKAREA